ncbi:coiled-coil domain-containing protein 153 isoform X2 [Oncorhynchus masou masou]|uniref:coiled-coil domain-containing protein 153 isoform X2 n=1 Tax=Oncorhynchus masou masou TaxID=90313 RepID=UPI00318465FA
MNATRCHHSNNGKPSNAQLFVGISIVEEFCSRIMPPKKKKGKSNINKSKTKNKKANEGGSELEEKYRRSALDVTVLRDHLALRGDVAQQAQSISHELRSRMRDMEQELHHERLDRKDVNADLTRQHKTMQTDMTVKVKRLGGEAILLREQLAQCQEELRAERKAHEQLQQEKDTTIADLQNKLDDMETNYEKILHDTLDSLTSQLAEARLRWEHESTVVHQEYKELLSDFGLNSLDI